MIIIEILIAIGIGIWFHKVHKKVKELRVETQERENLCTQAANELQEIHKNQDKLIKENDQLAKQIYFHNGILETTKKQNEEKLAQLELEQQKNKEDMLDRMRAEYATDAGKIVEELNQIKASLSRERAHIKAVAASRKLSEKESTNRDFHRICVPLANISDIDKLKKLAGELKKPEVLYKLIWKEYYQTLTNQMIDRVVGSGKVSGIYKITYIPDGRCYIGRSVDIAERFRQHIKCGLKAAKGTAPFYDSLFTLGVENFTFEILESIDFGGSTDELPKLEAYYIDFYDSVASGFNTVSGSR